MPGAPDSRGANRYVVVGGEFELLGFAYDALEEAAREVTTQDLCDRIGAVMYLKGFHEALYAAHLEKVPGVKRPDTI